MSALRALTFFHIATVASKLVVASQQFHLQNANVREYQLKQGWCCVIACERNTAAQSRMQYAHISISKHLLMQINAYSIKAEGRCAHFNIIREFAGVPIQFARLALSLWMLERKRRWRLYRWGKLKTWLFLNAAARNIFQLSRETVVDAQFSLCVGRTLLLIENYETKICICVQNSRASCVSVRGEIKMENWCDRSQFVARARAPGFSQLVQQ